MGAVLRDARPKSATPLVIGGHANVYAATAKDGAKHLPLDSGINPIAAVKGSEGPRVPAIIIASSPHKVGRVETPWQDTFDPDRGFVRFFGDNKTPGADPATSPGNRVLLEQLALHAAPTEATRRRAAPIIFFERVAVDGKRKGFPRFQGFGLLRGAEVVVQLDKNGDSFSNYAFEFVVLTLAPEHEVFDWSWINTRRDAGADLVPATGLVWPAVRRLREAGGAVFAADNEEPLPALRHAVVSREQDTMVDVVAQLAEHR
jgi:hypothetical protein